MSKKDDEKVLYGRAGKADGLNPKKPLEVQEKQRTDRAQTEGPCHDCGHLIAKGEVHVVSSVECTEGMKGTTHRYSIHEACYPVVGQVVAVLGKEATHTFAGRPPLTELWKQHHQAIRRQDVALATMLQQAFGEP